VSTEKVALAAGEEDMVWVIWKLHAFCVLEGGRCVDIHDVEEEGACAVGNVI